MTDGCKRQVLGDNAIRWFGLKAGELPDRSVADRLATAV